MIREMASSPKGSTTIEAILVIQVLLLSLTILLFSFVLMYHQTMLSRAALLASQEGARIWLQDNNLYYRLFEDDPLRGNQDYVRVYPGCPTADTLLPADNRGFYEEKFRQIEKFALPYLSRPLRLPEATTIEIHYENGFLTRKLTVALSQEMSIPLGVLIKFFNGKETVTLKGTGSAVITHPPELIRSLDLALEYGTKVKGVSSLAEARKKILGGIRK